MSQSIFTNLDRQLDDLDSIEFGNDKRKVCEVNWSILMIIEFLVGFGLSGDKVVIPYPLDRKYADTLRLLFSNLEFIIYNDEIFTNRTAEQLRGKGGRYILIGVFEEDTITRLDELRVWVEILNPDISLIRFYTSDIKYLDGGGLHYLPGIMIPTDSEIYVWAYDKGLHRYDLAELNGILGYHHLRVRTVEYELIEGVTIGEIKCRCYNCSAKLYILGLYCRKYCPDTKVEDICSKIFK
jgi:hypothetical protein